MFQVRKHSLTFARKAENQEEDIKVTLIQELYPERTIGKTAGHGLYVGRIHDSDNGAELRSHVLAILARVQENADMVMISEHPGNKISLDLFQEHADRDRQIIIARLGHYVQGDSGKTTNSVAVIAPGHDPVIVNQISFSEEDLKYYAKAKLYRGSDVHVFSTPIGNLGVISCHDYTNADILKELMEYDIEILVVSSFNPATRLFMQYALADIHRFSCFVIISNIGNYGGSGVFAPFRYNGPRKASQTLGGAIAYTQGETSAFLEVDLPLADLRTLRNKNKEESNDFDITCPWIPIQPSEEFLSEGQPDFKIKLQSSDFLVNIDLEKMGYVSPKYQGEVNIGVAHLLCLEAADYIDNYYCISSAQDAPRFIKDIQNHLRFLSEKLELSSQKLDFLVFPEVFLPMAVEEDLKEFARRFHTIIIGGVEFDTQLADIRQPEQAHGANRCFIYVPSESGGVKRFQYDKLTRSQYDARLPAVDGGEPGYFEMEKGNKLLRFSYPGHWDFGVLICYDYSHYDIVHRINRDASHEMPPDILFIVANNPDSQLYERCCIADSHRYYQYIVMCNVAQYGGSGIFGPIKTPGHRQTLLSAGVAAEGISVHTVAMSELQDARKASHISANSNFQHKPGIFQMPILVNESSVQGPTINPNK
ncbi:MAG TPA: hypothetical protein VN426_01295 [Syntrophomonadaceae bacterium]|nr:hypothetical protein [Syntrophomonadaceae bacterium]